MGVTDTYLFPYPELDEEPNGPSEIQALAESVDDALAGVVASLPTDGWSPLPGAWAFGVADAPTYTMVAAGSDQTARVSVGCRIKLTHAAAVKYFIVTAVAFAGGNTTLTLYGGTDYALAAGAITLVNVARDKAPHGFPLNPAKWTQTFTDTASRVQASPVGGTWYNPGALQIALPIGAWDVWYEAVGLVNAGGTQNQWRIGLSTVNNNVTDAETVTMGWQAVGGDGLGYVSKRKTIVVAAKTTYFLNVYTPNGGMTSIAIRGDLASTFIRAKCAYL